MGSVSDFPPVPPHPYPPREHLRLLLRALSHDDDDDVSGRPVDLQLDRGWVDAETG